MNWIVWFCIKMQIFFFWIIIVNNLLLVYFHLISTGVRQIAMFTVILMSKTMKIASRQLDVQSNNQEPFKKLWKMWLFMLKSDRALTIVQVVSKAWSQISVQKLTKDCFGKQFLCWLNWVAQKITVKAKYCCE